MKEGSHDTEVQIPETPGGTAGWLRMLAREINTYVLFLQTWSAMGFLVNPEVVNSLLEFQSRVMEARSELKALNQGVGIEDMRDVLTDIANQEEEMFGKMMDEIRRFKEETEDLFPAMKLNFDPCF